MKTLLMSKDASIAWAQSAIKTGNVEALEEWLNQKGWCNMSESNSGPLLRFHQSASSDKFMMPPPDQMLHDVFQKAIEQHQIACAKCLLDYGADLHAHNEKGLSAIHIAAKSGHIETLKWLLSQGARLHQRDLEKRTVLHMASEQGWLEMVKFFHQLHMDLDVPSLHGHTALHWAALSGHEPVVKYLVEQGVNLNKGTTPDRFTAKDLACENEHYAIELYLEKAMRQNQKNMEVIKAE